MCRCVVTSKSPWEVLACCCRASVHTSVFGHGVAVVLDSLWLLCCVFHCANGVSMYSCSTVVGTYSVCFCADLGCWRLRAVRCTMSTVVVGGSVRVFMTLA